MEKIFKIGENRFQVNIKLLVLETMQKNYLKMYACNQELFGIMLGKKN